MPERAAPVPYTPYPTEQAGGGGGTPMGVRATPEDFGAQVSQATEAAGKEGFDVAQHYQDIYNDSRARNIVTQGSLQLGNLEAQYKQNRGNNAVGALQSFQKQALDLQSQMVTSAGNPMAADKVKADFAREVDNSMRSAGDWAGQQAEAAHLQSYDSQIAAKVNLAAMHAGDTSRFNDDLSDIATLSAEKSAYSGHDSATADQIMSHNIGEATYASIRSLTNSDPNAAQALYEKMRDGGITAVRDGKQVTIPYLDAEHRARIETMMGTANQERQISQYTDQFPNMTTEEIQNTVAGLKKKPDSSDGASSDISSAISKQEHPGSKPEPVSIDGAVGNHQIMPDTFALYAKPGEKIDNPADNDAVYGRIMADYQKKYNNDPARIATAYFSGTGNVAPAGSPTPWIKDAQDGNGKTVSSYVKDVQDRIGKGTGVTQVATSQDNWLHDTVADAANKYLKKINDDPRGTWDSMHGGGQPINISDSKSVASGIQTALAISGQYNVPVAKAVWSKNDAARLVSNWESMPLNSDDNGVQSKQSTLMAIREGAGPYAADVLAPLKATSPNIVYAAGIDDPKTAMEIVKGDERIREDKDKDLPLSKVDARMQAAGYDQTLLPQQYDQVKSAARSVFAARYSSGQNIQDDAIDGVIKDSLGGMSQSTYNGKTILTPPHVSANQMETFLNGVTNNDLLVGMQNANMQLTNSIGPSNIELPRGKNGDTFQVGQTPFTLQSVGPGLYLALQPNGEAYAAPGMKGGKMFLKFNPEQIVGKNSEIAAQPDKTSQLEKEGGVL
jgi:hypothetical protein